jgi:hypothetical protein
MAYLQTGNRDIRAVKKGYSAQDKKARKAKINLTPLRRSTATSSPVAATHYSEPAELV